MSDEVLNSTALVDQARVDTGIDDFGEDTWQEGLERLLEASPGRGPRSCSTSWPRTPVCGRR